MNKYSVIVFDLGNVLIPFDYTICIKRMNEVSKGLGDKFIKFYKDNYHLHREHERGDISAEQFTEKMLEVLDYKLTKLQFSTFFSEIFSENTEVTKLLPILKKEYRLVLLSNTNEIHRQYGYKNYQFLQNFEKLFLSHEVRAIKPEDKIYQAVTEYTGEEPGRHLFIDDIQEYCDGARRNGWDAIQFVSQAKLIKDLQALHIIP